MFDKSHCNWNALLFTCSPNIFYLLSETNTLHIRAKGLHGLGVSCGFKRNLVNHLQYAFVPAVRFMFVCQQDNSKSYEWISMAISGNFHSGTRTDTILSRSDMEHDCYCPLLSHLRELIDGWAKLITHVQIFPLCGKSTATKILSEKYINLELDNNMGIGWGHE